MDAVVVIDWVIANIIKICLFMGLNYLKGVKGVFNVFISWTVFHI